jgi:hypothetical protein
VDRGRAATNSGPTKSPDHAVTEIVALIVRPSVAVHSYRANVRLWP